MVEWEKFYKIPAGDFAGLIGGGLATTPLLFGEELVTIGTVLSDVPGWIPTSVFTVADGLLANYAMNTAKESSGPWQSFSYGATGSLLAGSLTNLVETIILLAGHRPPHHETLTEEIDKLKEIAEQFKVKSEEEAETETETEEQKSTALAVPEEAILRV